MSERQPRVWDATVPPQPDDADHVRGVNGEEWEYREDYFVGGSAYWWCNGEAQLDWAELVTTQGPLTEVVVEP